MEYYKTKVITLEENLHKVTSTYTGIALLRIVLVASMIFLVISSLNHLQAVNIIFIALLLIVFLLLLKYHQSLSYQKKLLEQLVAINKKELEYFNSGTLSFEDGKEFIQEEHLYSFDLDIFGPGSLFQHLNRTASYSGKLQLADKLSTGLHPDNIKINQEAIKELSGKIDFRHFIQASAQISKLDKTVYTNLLTWSKITNQSVALWALLLRWMLPVLFLLSFSLAFFMDNPLAIYVANMFFLLNLMMLAIFLKRIKSSMIEGDKISETIQHYANIFEHIKNEKFHSDYLNQLQQNLGTDDLHAAQLFRSLSKILGNLSSMLNPIGAVFFNGALLYHLGEYIKLVQWKQKHGQEIAHFLVVLGELEALNALANLYYNNPDFTFPVLNKTQSIQLKNCGHPLINSNKRVCNDIHFEQGQFMILTGSNMSGKSTFLRTLGINMVLTNAGAPVCASEAHVHPLPVIVSMRMTDSLNHGESYFFAEVKRLKQMMITLEKQLCFVLLDEILKGTNSDDKRTGTIKVLEKMIQKKAIGVVATHDLEVCTLSNSYPEKLFNYCFEVTIINEELHFDYKLRNGICKNKSATFLMNKMEII